MAAATYTSDLTDIITDMASTTGWTAIGGGAAGLVAPETDFYKQGNNCISKAGWSSAIKGIIYNNGSGVTIPSGKALFVFVEYWAPNSLAAEASGGIRVIIGSGTGAYNQWYVSGSDYMGLERFPCLLVDPTVSADTTTGSPTSTLQYFGALANVPSSGPSKGQPLGIDAIRYGRDYTCEFGDVGNGYATFAGAAAYNDNITRQYGQFTSIRGGYLMLGGFLMGSATNAVDFRDSNKVISIGRAPRVASDFHRFEVRNASSRVDWTNISISALGTNSKGYFSCVDNADVNIDACTFTDMSTFTFQSNSTITDTVFRRCGQITQGGAAISGCQIIENTASPALVVSDFSVLSDTHFVSDGTGHALQIASAGTYSFSGLTFDGYAGSNGSTGNEVVNVTASSGTVTINVSGGGDTPTYQTAGATVVISAAADVTLTGLVAGTEIHAYTGVPGASAVEIGTGTESSGTSYTFSQSEAGNAGFITIIKPGYKFLTITLTYSSLAQTIPVQQQDDPGYSNP
jgi:hypothetical protein